jgi:hypothetical protein
VGTLSSKMYGVTRAAKPTFNTTTGGIVVLAASAQSNRILAIVDKNPWPMPICSASKLRNRCWASGFTRIFRIYFGFCLSGNLKTQILFVEWIILTLNIPSSVHIHSVRSRPIR